jgi:archaellum component FlaC
MKILDKLTTYASLIGVIGAIGGGFYAWGEFNTRLSAIENKEFTVNEVVDLTPVNNKIADIRVEVIDRIKAIEDKLAQESDNNIDEIWKDIEEVQEELAEAQKDIAIVKKENELQDSKIEAVRLKATNPLAN